MSEELQRDEDKDLAQTKFEYAWRYFAYHARQRVTMFHFFLLGSGVIGNAYALLLRGQLHLEAGVVAMLGLIVCFVFFCLEIRNHQLVNLGEDALMRVELDYLLSPAELRSEHTTPEYAIMTRERKVGVTFFLCKHGTLILLLQSAVAAGFAAAASYSLYMLFCELSAL